MLNSPKVNRQNGTCYETHYPIICRHLQLCGEELLYVVRCQGPEIYCTADLDRSNDVTPQRL